VKFFQLLVLAYRVVAHRKNTFFFNEPARLLLLALVYASCLEIAWAGITYPDFLHTTCGFWR
jgi:hypothetical protein